tara:strand:+ start:807 stop:1145 length:339 start_codon:yes stop_codon:yes gene_type:complete
MEYLYHCAGCEKPDKDYPNEEVQCSECEGTGYYYNSIDDTSIEDEETCFSCKGYGTYVPRCRPLEYHKWARNDAYGIYTGLYCDKCYKHNYPYKKYRYHDESYCGERIEPNE